ncbi:hypothetical protein [Lysinibacillus fusiformis]|nr:hypothetical protein [Lysinibacillus fusiformis]
MQLFWENDYKEDGYYVFDNPSIEVIEQTKHYLSKSFSLCSYQLI